MDNTQKKREKEKSHIFKCTRRMGVGGGGRPGGGDMKGGGMRMWRKTHFPRHDSLWSDFFLFPLLFSFFLSFFLACLLVLVIFSFQQILGMNGGNIPGLISAALPFPARLIETQLQLHQRHLLFQNQSDMFGNEWRKYPRINACSVAISRKWGLKRNCNSINAIYYPNK